MAHCSMFIKKKGKVFNCIINKDDEEVFKDLGFTNDGASLLKPKESKKSLNDNKG